MTRRKLPSPEAWTMCTKCCEKRSKRTSHTCIWSDNWSKGAPIFHLWVILACENRGTQFWLQKKKAFAKALSVVQAARLGLWVQNFPFVLFSFLVGSRTVRKTRQLIGATEDHWEKLLVRPDGPLRSHSRVASSRVLAEKRKVRFSPVDKAATGSGPLYYLAAGLRKSPFHLYLPQARSTDSQFSPWPPEAKPSLTPSPTVLAKDCGWSKALWQCCPIIGPTDCVTNLIWAYFQSGNLEIYNIFEDTRRHKTC